MYIIYDIADSTATILYYCNNINYMYVFLVHHKMYKCGKK